MSINDRIFGEEDVMSKSQMKRLAVQGGEMSDTPKTDASMFSDGSVFKLCRELERELAAANARAEQDAGSFALRLSAMQRDVDDAQQDAERYRWLRQSNTVPYGTDTRGEIQHLIVFWDSGPELDAAIDAAREA